MHRSLCICKQLAVLVKVDYELIQLLLNTCFHDLKAYHGNRTNRQNTPCFSFRWLTKFSLRLSQWHALRLLASRQYQSRMQSDESNPWKKRKPLQHLKRVNPRWYTLLSNMCLSLARIKYGEKKDKQLEMESQFTLDFSHEEHGSYMVSN